MSVADTIAAQMGGYGRLRAFLGADQFVAMQDGLKIRFKGSPKANTVVVKLMPDDTYDMDFYKARGLNYPLVASIQGLYAEQLRHAFTSFTGLFI